MDAEIVIRSLALEPHPEGGWYRETWADGASTAIYYLLVRDEPSAWHRVRGRAEVWHHYAGAPLELEMDEHGPGTGDPRTVALGTDLADRPASASRGAAGRLAVGADAGPLDPRRLHRRPPVHVRRVRARSRLTRERTSPPPGSSADAGGSFDGRKDSSQ